MSGAPFVPKAAPCWQPPEGDYQGNRSALDALYPEPVNELPIERMHGKANAVDGKQGPNKFTLPEREQGHRRVRVKRRGKIAGKAP